MASATDAEEALRLTKERENLQQLIRLLIYGGTTLLREKFDSIHSPSDLPSKLGDPAIKTKLRRAGLTNLGWKCLYPSPDTFGKSADFDITMMFKLFRTICNLTEPATRWYNLPNSTDHSLEADLVRIKYYRNYIYGHNSKMEIMESEFRNLWKEISEALLRIAGSINQAKRDEWNKAIDKLLNDPVVPEAHRYIEERNLWYKNDREIKGLVKQRLNEQLREVSRDQNREISELCERMLAYKIGTYEELDGEMEGCRLNIALLGLNGSGKSALINNIFESLGIESEPAITQSTGKESMMTLDGYAVPGTQITLYDPRGFFELDRTEQGNSNYLRISIKKFLIDIMP
ncbi:uncharacterized protein LOC110050366 [Orbicella faveolata]|uniref:uncharacterized protein LOC110050366 n=1 Tax=Orbicella faveolata TaxID=48498 RepID=UPI0009E5F141|nr:uncharacterized protein LOC110050366 [Orbicella faveolata]